MLTFNIGYYVYIRYALAVDLKAHKKRTETIDNDDVEE